MNKLIQRNRQLKNRKGFTLIELIVVIAILGILAAVLVPQLGGFTNKAREAQGLTTAQTISTAIEVFNVENGAYPTATNEAAIETLAGIEAGSLTLSDDDGYFKYVTTFDGKTVTVTRTNLASKPTAVVTD